MLDEFLNELSFPLHSFYKELDRKQLLFLYFCCQGEEDVEELPQNDNLFTIFNEMTSKKNIMLRKLKKQEVINDLTNFYKEDTKGFVKLLQYEFCNPDLILINNMLKGIYLVVEYTFRKKIKNIIKVVTTNENHSDFNSILDEYFMNEKPLLNFLGAISLIVKIDTFCSQHNFSSISDHILNIKLSLLERLMYYYHQFDVQEHINLSKDLVSMEAKIDKLTKDLQKNKDTLLKSRQLSKTIMAEKKELTKQIKELTKQIKDISKEKVNDDSEIVTQLINDLRNKDDIIRQKDIEIKELKERPSSMYTTLINDLNKQILLQKEQNRDKTKEIRELKNTLFKYDNMDFNEYLKKYLSKGSLSKKSFEIISPYYEQYEKNLIEKEKAIAIIEKPKKESYIGRCIISGQTHYVSFPNGTEVEITNIPENTYLAEGQFILIDQEGRFRWSYQYKYNKYDNDYIIKKFASIVEMGVKVDIGNGILEIINKVPQNIQFRDKQIVALGANNDYIRYYTPLKYNADYFLKSALVRGYSVSYVIKVFQQGCLLRNIETSEEYFKDIDSNNFQIKEQIIVVLKNDKVINTINNTKFYTLSSYYKNVQYGTVEIKEDRVLLRKLNDEIVLVSGVPMNLEVVTGQVINIDEYNNYLSLRFEDTPEELRKPFLNSILYKKNKVTKTQQPNIELNKSVCILGNISFDKNYKLACYKIGYKAEVIDGFSSWEKIFMQIKNIDLAIVIPSFISHDNMWKLKGLKDIHILFPDSDGANRITNEILEYEKKKQAVVQ